MKREALKIFQADGIKEKQLSVEYAGETRRYRLIERVGDGKTAVAWLASDSQNRNWVLKFALREEYNSHSLESEIARVNKLQTDLVAKIDFFGVPKDDSGNLVLDEFYAIAVEWIDGVTLQDYLAAPDLALTVDAVCQMTRDLCEVLKCLADCNLSHSDLHDRNIMVYTNTDPMSGAKTQRLIAIDTGQLKTIERQSDLLERWRTQLEDLDNLEENEQIREEKARLLNWLNYFGRTDHEWVIKHLCDIYNALASSSLDAGRCLAFIKDVPHVLSRAIDPDPTARLNDPVSLYNEVKGKAPTLLDSDETHMQSPFDLPSAELIRSDRQLMSLFSDEYPRLDECRSNSPVYIYGPRGCGKSTILRSMSLNAILKSGEPELLLAGIEFFGTYISCSTEFRSRFWLFKEADFETLESHIVMYFSLLLTEGLCDTLDGIYKWDRGKGSDAFGLSDDIAQQCIQVIQKHLSLAVVTPYHQTSPFAQIRLLIRSKRDQLWKQILDRSTPQERPNAQLIFDIARDLETVCPFLKKKRLAFLIDDYSNQRIPSGLQRRLNQSITFAKQSNPIFKVSSEYFALILKEFRKDEKFEKLILDPSMCHSLAKNDGHSCARFWIVASITKK